MVLTLEDNQIAIRACIHYKVKQGIEIEKAYRQLCKALGKDFMEYTEYEGWFYRFYNGNLDLEYDRSLDPKTRTFIEMPVSAIESIWDNVQATERFRFRKVCSSLNIIFNNRFPQSYKIKIVCHNDHTNLYLNDKSKKLEEKNIFKGITPEQIMMDDMVYMMKHPKLKIEKLEIHFDIPLGIDQEPQHCLFHITHLLKSLAHKIHVKEVCGRARILILLLPYMEAGALERIELHDFLILKGDVLLINKFFELEQWKKAKELHCVWAEWFFKSINHLNHFTRFVLNLKLDSGQDVWFRIKFILQNFPNLETCVLFTEKLFNIADVWSALELSNPNNSDDPKIRHYPIPNSNEFFEVSFEGWIRFSDFNFFSFTNSINERDSYYKRKKYYYFQINRKR